MTLEILVATIAGLAWCEPIEIPPPEPTTIVRRVKTETIEAPK